MSFYPNPPYITDITEERGEPPKPKKRNRGRMILANGYPRACNEATLPHRTYSRGPMKGQKIRCKPGMGGGRAPYFECAGRKVSLPAALIKVRG